MARLESSWNLFKGIYQSAYMFNEESSSIDRRLYQRIAYRQILSAMLNESLSVKNAKKG